MNELVLDIETTGLPPKGGQYYKDYKKYPYPVSISWLYKGIMHDYIINQKGREVPRAASNIHGITTKIANASPHMIKNVIHDLMLDCQKASIIVGHNIFFDLSIIKANIIRELQNSEYTKEQKSNYYSMFNYAVSKEKRIDTMMKTVKFCKLPSPRGSGYKWPRLEELYKILFNETFNAHRSKDDVEATHRCFVELVKKNVIVIP